MTDKQVLHYFELPKLPKKLNTKDGLNLWLTLLNAGTEEDLAKIEALEVSVMQETISAYRQITATEEFKEIERIRSLSRHKEASALHNAQQLGAKLEREKWQSVIIEKDRAITEKDIENENLRKQLAELTANRKPNE